MGSWLASRGRGALGHDAVCGAASKQGSPQTHADARGWDRDHRGSAARHANRVGFAVNERAGLRPIGVHQRASAVKPSCLFHYPSRGSADARDDTRLRRPRRAGPGAVSGAGICARLFRVPLPGRRASQFGPSSSVECGDAETADKAKRRESLRPPLLPVPSGITRRRNLSDFLRARCRHASGGCVLGGQPTRGSPPCPPPPKRNPPPPSP